VSLWLRAGKAMDKVYLRLRHPKAFEVSSGAAGTFDALRGHKYALLVTFRRSGEAMPAPVWFGVDEGGTFFTRTRAEAGKVKRLRNDPRALLAPCTLRGRPLGAAIEGRGRVLARDEWERAERAIRANYGLGRKLYQLPADPGSEAMTYLEITPAPSASPTASPTNREARVRRGDPRRRR
jgi:uncharacterized protein